MKKSMEWYRNNRKEFFEHHLFCEAFYSIECIIDEPTQEEYEIIAQASYQAYMKDENGLGICKIADFLAHGIANNKITLNMISNASKWDILNAVIEKSYKYIK